MELRETSPLFVGAVSGSVSANCVDYTWVCCCLIPGCFADPLEKPDFPEMGHGLDGFRSTPFLAGPVVVTACVADLAVYAPRLWC